MDSLPDEIVLQILDTLFKSVQYIAPYASVSRNWQHAIEQMTFRCLHVFSPEVDIFRSIYNIQRRQYVQKLIFYPVVLIDANSKTLTQAQRVELRVSQSVPSLLDVIRALDKHEALPDSGLYLAIAPPRVVNNPNEMVWNPQTRRLTEQLAQNIIMGSDYEIFSGVNAFLLSLDTYRASLNNVNSLEFFEEAGIGYDPSAIIGMVRACPNLLEFSWRCRRFTGSPTREASLSTLESSLHTLEVHQAEKIIFETILHATNMYAHVGLDVSSPSLDVMHTAWKTFSSFQKLKSLVLHGTFGPRSFDLCFWPNLQDCQITFEPFSVNGQRHFLHNANCCIKQQHNENDTDSDAWSDSESSWPEHAARFYHHNLPNPDTVPAMIVSLLTAANRMPQLRLLTFRNIDTLRTCLDTAFTITFHGVGNAAHVGNADDQGKRVDFNVGIWRPPDAGEQGERITQTLAELDIPSNFL